MLNGPFALALTAGMAATVNPCGFALLPAYLASFVGLQDRATRLGAVGRALAVSAVLTGGFVTVFGLLGAVLSPVLQEVQDYAPWFTIVFGVLLVGLGVYLLTGRELVLKIPKMQRGGTDGTLASMYLFGVSYAVASLSCGIGGFLVVTSSASNADNFVSRVATFLVYGVGMGLIVTVLTIAVAFARQGVVARFRSLIPKMNRIAGGLMVIAGAYVAYYGWYEIRLFHLGSNGDDPIIDAALRIQAWMQGLMPNQGNYGWYVVGALVFVGGATAWSMRTRRPAEPGISPG